MNLKETFKTFAPVDVPRFKKVKDKLEVEYHKEIREIDQNITYTIGKEQMDSVLEQLEEQVA